MLILKSRHAASGWTVETAAAVTATVSGSVTVAMPRPLSLRSRPSVFVKGWTGVTGVTVETDSTAAMACWFLPF